MPSRPRARVPRLGDSASSPRASSPSSARRSPTERASRASSGAGGIQGPAGSW